MELKDFLERIADFCGHKNWAYFSMEENIKLKNIFEEIDQDAYSRALEENQCYNESDIDEARQEGYDEGYRDALHRMKVAIEDGELDGD